jgi:hypothetical protein
LLATMIVWRRTQPLRPGPRPCRRRSPALSLLCATSRDGFRSPPGSRASRRRLPTPRPRGQRVPGAPNAADATLVLDPDGRLAASTGCRAFDGEWVETGDELLFTTFGQTDDSPDVAADGSTS